MPFNLRNLLRSLFDEETSTGSVSSRSSLCDADSPSPCATPQPKRSRRGRLRRKLGLTSSPKQPASPGLTASSRAPSPAPAPPYSPKRFDGEYNVWFARKPLGLGLVPSTQLYGTWEVSSVAAVPPPETTKGAKSDGEQAVNEAAERNQIHVGDVVIAVNLNTDNAQLPRAALAKLLHRSALPIVITLRNPEVYGSFDSRSLATAMFPASTEYRAVAKQEYLPHHAPGSSHAHGKSFHARASSMQWKRNLQHELMAKKLQQLKQRRRQLRQNREREREKARAAATLATQEEVTPAEATTAVGTGPPPERASLPCNLPPPGPSAGYLRTPEARAMQYRSRMSSSTSSTGSSPSVELNHMGEYDYVFSVDDDTMLDMEFAPSTRLYGSVEIYDPKMFAPMLQVGDVVLAVNGDDGIMHWPTDEALDFLTQLMTTVKKTTRRGNGRRSSSSSSAETEPLRLLDIEVDATSPITLRLRRPAAYREYLQTLFRTTSKPMSSHSTARAMFPNSAEYQRGKPSTIHHQKRPTPASTNAIGPVSSSQGAAVHPRPAARPSAMLPPRHHGRSHARRDSVSGSAIVVNARSHGRPGSSGVVTKPNPSRKVPSAGIHNTGIAHTLSKRDWQGISSRFSKKNQFKLWRSCSSTSDYGAADDGAPAPDNAVKHHSSAFLTQRHVQFLWHHLPESLTCNAIQLVYDTRHDGWNLLTFYDRLKDHGPALLVIKDTRDHIFGAFTSASWKHSAGVYGNGRSFVFTLRPAMKAYPWSGLEASFMSGRPDAFIMGGGKRGIALCVKLDEFCGFSQACETFDSPPLASSNGEDVNGGHFDIENMEVWCFSGLSV